MDKHFYNLKGMKNFLLLWFTQTLSGLGSAMTAYALIIWSYTQESSTANRITDGLFLYSLCVVQRFCRT